MEGWTNGQFVGLIGHRTNGQIPVFGLCEEAGVPRIHKDRRRHLKVDIERALGIALTTILS